MFERVTNAAANRSAYPILVTCLVQSPIWFETCSAGKAVCPRALPAIAGPENRLYLTAAHSIVMVAQLGCPKPEFQTLGS